MIRSCNRLLTLFFVFIAVLIMVRLIYSGSSRYVFLVWNIFLAWIPYILSAFLVRYSKKEKYKQGILFISWLLFFPNALYIITDLIHLQQSTNVPLWYDAILLFASSFIGLMMAFISLYRIEIFLRGIFNRRMVMGMISGIMFIGSFGVYLGRFQRWNSWNVINDPLALGLDIFSRFMNPVDHVKTWAITVILTVFYSMLYMFIKIIPDIFKTPIHKRM